MDLRLAGKTAIITGGASNIGHGIVMAFASEGANVVIADIDEAQAQRTAELARKSGVRLLVTRTDVTKPEQCEDMAKIALDEFGRIDIIVNNAGIGPGSMLCFREITREVALKVMDLNYWGAFNCTKAVLEHMIARKSGNIIHISSSAGRVGNNRVAIYSSAKAGLIGLTRAQAWEFAQYGIRVNTICPSGIVPASREEVSEDKWEKSQGAKMSPLLQEVYNSMAIKELGHPADIGNMAVFLASDSAHFITGQSLSVDGGQVML